MESRRGAYHDQGRADRSGEGMRHPVLPLARSRAARGHRGQSQTQGGRVDDHHARRHRYRRRDGAQDPGDDDPRDAARRRDLRHRLGAAAVGRAPRGGRRPPDPHRRVSGLAVLVPRRRHRHRQDAGHRRHGRHRPRDGLARPRLQDENALPHPHAPARKRRESARHDLGAVRRTAVEVGHRVDQPQAHARDPAPVQRPRSSP